MNDYLRELGHLGMIARLKRLSDSMLYSIREVYKKNGFDIEPNWHFVFLSLKKHETRTMSELADSFGLSQPATVKIINKMKMKEYVDFVTDSNDGRKRQLRLTAKAKSELPKFEEVWNSGQRSIGQLLEQNESFMNILDRLEDQLKEKSFDKRITENLNT